MDNLRNWELHGSMPPEGKNQWRPNKTVYVRAMNIIRAITLAQRKFPGFEVFTVSHRGGIHMLEEKPSDFPDLGDNVGTG